MSSPLRKSNSIKKINRPTTAAPKAPKTGGDPAIEEINALQCQLQDKDIEIERLKTTCQTLNSKVLVTDDLQKEIDQLRRSLEQSEKHRQMQKEEIEE